MTLLEIAALVGLFGPSIACVWLWEYRSFQKFYGDTRAFAEELERGFKDPAPNELPGIQGIVTVLSSLDGVVSYRPNSGHKPVTEDEEAACRFLERHGFIFFWDLESRWYVTIRGEYHWQRLALLADMHLRSRPLAGETS